MSEVKVNNGNIEDALKRFKRQCARNGVLQEVRKREHYEKPSVKRKASLYSFQSPPTQNPTSNNTPRTRDNFFFVTGTQKTPHIMTTSSNTPIKFNKALITISPITPLPRLANNIFQIGVLQFLRLPSAYRNALPIFQPNTLVRIRNIAQVDEITLMAAEK